MTFLLLVYISISHLSRLATIEDKRQILIKSLLSCTLTIITFLQKNNMKYMNPVISIYIKMIVADRVLGILDHDQRNETSFALGIIYCSSIILSGCSNFLLDCCVQIFGLVLIYSFVVYDTKILILYIMFPFVIFTYLKARYLNLREVRMNFYYKIRKNELKEIHSDIS